MANTLTTLIPSLIGSLNLVARRTGFLFNAVTLDAQAAQAGYGQSVSLPGAASMSVESVTPAAVAPTLGDHTAVGSTLTLSNWKATRFHLNQEEMQAMASKGPAFQAAQVGEAISTLVNSIGTSVATTISEQAYLGIGTAGTTPFASSMDILADLGYELDTNLAGAMDRYLVINPAAKANLFKLDIAQQRNTAPEGVNFAKGQFMDLLGFNAGMDQSIVTETKGTGSGYVSDGGAALGATSITLKTGTGTVLAGDIVTFAGDTNIYVVKTGVAAAGTIVLTSGLRVALDDGDAMTIGASHAANLAVHKAATCCAIRPDLNGNDLARDAVVITDPASGLSLLVSEYPGYKTVQYTVSAVWGQVVRRPEWALKLLG